MKKFKELTREQKGTIQGGAMMAPADGEKKKERKGRNPQTGK